VIRNRNGYWQVRVYAGLDPFSGHKRWRYDRARSEVEARAVERRLQAEVEQARCRQARTVAELLARWVEWAEQVRELSPSTLVAYRHWINRVILPGVRLAPSTTIGRRRRLRRRVQGGFGWAVEPQAPPRGSSHRA